MTAVCAGPLGGALSPFRDMLVWADDAVPSDPEPLADWLGRFQRTVGGTWQPACSLWAQIYFNTLLIPALCLVARDGARGAATLNGVFCPTSGRPLRFALCPADPAINPAGETALLDLVDRHVGRLIADLQAVSHLSRRLLRESAARTVRWTVDEIARSDAAGARAVSAQFAARSDARALCLSLCDGADCRRRTCCLRDRVPGQPSCGAVCPSRCARAGVTGPTELAHDA